jgi:ABC-2 type transport system ATP-binding protein
MLELHGLTKRYGEVVALDGATFRVPPGRMVGFLGPNGAGKTTAMRGIFGLLRLDSGEVTWNGEPVDADAARRFGYMPEARGLYPKMKVGEQIEYFATLHGADRAAARAQAARWMERLGLEDRVDSTVETLSHGNQQRVQLAVSLAFESDLLVLDEPFSGLDPIAVQTMGEVIREEAARGAAVLFSSHQLDLVEDLCDDLVVIDRGRVVLSGALADVRAASPFRYVEVSGPAANTRWYSQIEGAQVVVDRPSSVRVRIPSQTDPAVILDLARGQGDVVGFSFEPPTLSDLFVEAVQR